MFWLFLEAEGAATIHTIASPDQLLLPPSASAVKVGAAFTAGHPRQRGRQIV